MELLLIRLAETYLLATVLGSSRAHGPACGHSARQIFATDIDDHALGIARSGRYPATLLDSVSPERRERFFISDGASYVVSKEVRDLCKPVALCRSAQPWPRGRPRSPEIAQQVDSHGYALVKGHTMSQPHLRKKAAHPDVRFCIFAFRRWSGGRIYFQ
jgi:hypothetical protein